MEARLLGTDDAALLEAFLRERRDSSMFMRFNLQRAGFEDRGERFQATYAGSFRGGVLSGVVAHCWNGFLILQAPDGLEQALRAVLAHTSREHGRKIAAFLGPTPQVQQARKLLGLSAAATRPSDSEWLFGLDLADLLPPEALRIGFLECRPPLPRERALLTEWRMAYEVESLGAEPGEQLRISAEHHVSEQMEAGHVWVAVSRGTPVSMAAFNAVLPASSESPGMVQLGGVFTPLTQRGRGFAQTAVAGALLAARERGVQRAVLFTSNPSAVRTYERIGFRRVGEYAVQVLVRPEAPQ
jgi:RimJ/RimL family protein N-acetyltransferase